ncbi:hypothetical protein GGR56DRAFT_569805 [Xylariaceae sp. FL0804]|nr:hypothetical protein GGR56DRAFT_569805 [Xylariaceae sp. FL0804]
MLPGKPLYRLRSGGSGDRTRCPLWQHWRLCSVRVVVCLGLRVANSLNRQGHVPVLKLPQVLVREAFFGMNPFQMGLEVVCSRPYLFLGRTTIERAFEASTSGFRCRVYASFMSVQVVRCTEAFSSPRAIVNITLVRLRVSPLVLPNGDPRQRYDQQ